MEPTFDRNAVTRKRRGLWEPSRVKRNLLPIEKVTLAYIVGTALLVALLWVRMQHPVSLLLWRAGFLAVMAGLYVFHRRRPCRATRLLRSFFPIALTAYWYPETYDFCQAFQNMDHVFASFEYLVFLDQPSLSFPNALSGTFWRELFNLGYFSYYPLILITLALPLQKNRRLFEKTAFIVLASFLLYYLIYLFLPVAGPQYYFQAVGVPNITARHFPALGDYFRTHTELTGVPVPSGFFSWLVHVMQAAGERPTAAFPSSHVGISTILMILLYRHNRGTAYVALPFYILLCLSTVYIGAHYLIDVFGGLLSGVLFYYITHYYYSELHTRG
ncbi:MAG: phosphatase PAP2 family protein [Alloprevotella sp.]|nr:phosphatase PAP2 family protein [Prevotella sp.]MBR1712764.1 phosphatase PAP2 family protein [Alloprevotella sp.]